MVVRFFFLHYFDVVHFIFNEQMDAVHAVRSGEAVFLERPSIAVHVPPRSMGARTGYWIEYIGVLAVRQIAHPFPA